MVAGTDVIYNRSLNKHTKKKLKEFPLFSRHMMFNENISRQTTMNNMKYEILSKCSNLVLVDFTLKLSFRKSPEAHFLCCIVVVVQYAVLMITLSCISSITESCSTELIMCIQSCSWFHPCVLILNHC